MFIGDKYDYSKVEYINSYTKICIICKEHGEFWQTPGSHLNGSGCKKCSIKINSNKRKSIDFIERAKKVHGNKYDYSKVEYVNCDTKVCIICKEHGEFWQTPYNHLKGQNCPMCSHRSYKSTTKDFIEKAHKIHRR